jgi:hypothetical protein
MSKRPKHLRQSPWDVENAKYADLSSPEWVLNAQVPAKFWKDPENHRRYVVWLGRQLNIQHLDDWYQYTSDTFEEYRGSTLLMYYSNSHFRLLKEMFPQHDWMEWKFKNAPQGFWQSKENIRRYIQWFEKEMKIQSPEDWYRITHDDLMNHYGAGLLSRYPFDLRKLLKDVYPKQKWLQWKFVQVQPGFWDKLENRLEYLHWLGKTLGFKEIEDWYELKRNHFAQNDGATLIFHHYEKDLLRPLAELFPDYEFYPWMFDRVPVGYWDQPENCRDYLEWLAEQLHITELDGWYDVVRADFRNHFGAGYMQYFHTPYDALRFAYPDHNWLPWRFEKVPQGFWEDSQQVTAFMRWLGIQLGCKNPTDWDSVNCGRIAKIPGGNGLSLKYKLNAIRKMGADAMT